MFDFCAVIGYDIDKKPNLDLVLKNEYQAEILQIYPHHLKKSPLITQSISECFPKGEPYIYTSENKLFHPNHSFKSDNGIQSQIHQFQVQLDDQSIKYCYALSFYECAYIQTIETLAGNRVKVVTWSPQLEIASLINSKQVTSLKSALFQQNTHIKIYIQKSIIIVCNQVETGCEETLINYINKLMQQNGRQGVVQNQLQQDIQANLQEQLLINKELLQKQNRIPQLELESMVVFLNFTHQSQRQLVVAISDFDEGCQIKLIPIMKFIQHESSQNNNKNNQITLDLYHLHDIKTNQFNNPPDKLKQYIERVKKSKRKAKKPLIPIMPQILISKPIIEIQKINQNIRPQEFSFHESSDRKHSRTQIFSDLYFPQQKTLLKL